MTLILESGDKAYYPHLFDVSGAPMTVIGSRLIHYKTGKEFRSYFFKGHTDDNDGLIDRLVQDMHTNVSQDYDNLLIISGAEGSGKSNLAVQICHLFDPTFTLQERYIYDFLPFLEKLSKDASATPGKAYLLDEATNLVSNRDWNKETNKHMIQLLEMFRSRGLTLVMCIPSFDRLDVYIREHRARYNLICKDLAAGDKFRGRGYFELEILHPRKIYIGHGTFDQMCPEEKAEYEKIKLQSQESKLNEMLEAANDSGGSRYLTAIERNRKMAMYFIKTQGWSYSEVSETFDIPRGTLRRWAGEDREEEL